MACREPGLLDSVLHHSFRAALALALLAAPAAAGAARLSQVRVGTHEDHTRIVLELDEAASYRLAPPAGGGTRLQIQLDADSVARHVASKSPLVKAVRVEPSTRGSTVSVDLSQAGVEVSEMVLANPPRIVLDLKPAGSLAAAPVRPAAPPAAAPAAAPAPRPEPAPRVAAAEPPAAEQAKAPAAAAAESPRAPAPAPAAPPEAARKTAPAVATAETRAPSLSDPVPGDIAKVAPPAASPAPAETGAEKQAEPAPGRAEAPSAPATPSAAPAVPSTSPPPAPPARSAKPAEVVVRKPTPPPAAPTAAASPSWLDRLTSPVGYAAIGGVLLALVVLAVRRRRRDEDDDPLYSVMAADDAGMGEGDAQEESAVAWGRSDADDESTEYAPATARFDADEPISRDGSQQLALGRLQHEAAEPEAAEEEPGSLFEATAVPLSSAVSVPPPAEPAASAGVSAAGSFAGDATQIAAELEGRVRELERRLEQLAEARERLERQVAAQTEELRVQRAAIARTQRVVRSMSKGEDLATEPVPRAPQA